MNTPCTQSRIRYNPSTSQKTKLGFGIPEQFAAHSRNVYTALRLLHLSPQFMAVQVGGRKTAGFAPRVAQYSNPACTATRLESGSSSLTATWGIYMTNALTPFNFGQFAIRTTTVGDAVWFSAADVCDVLGIKNHRDSLQHLDDDEKGVVSNDTLGGQQRISVVNESGLYALVLRSRKPEARKFAKWVTSEVLPAIRKTGSYSAAPAAPAEKLPSLQFRRFLVWYDDNGAEQIKSVPIDACIISPSNPDKLAEFLLEMVPQHLIGEAIATLTGRTLRLLNDHQRQSTAAAAVKKLGGVK